MKNELETTDQNSLHKEFQNLLDQDFKNRELKENQVINAVVSDTMNRAFNDPQLLDFIQFN